MPATIAEPTTNDPATDRDVPKLITEAYCVAVPSPAYRSCPITGEPTDAADMAAAGRLAVCACTKLVMLAPEAAASHAPQMLGLLLSLPEESRSGLPSGPVADANPRIAPWRLVVGPHRWAPGTRTAMAVAFPNDKKLPYAPLSAFAYSTYMGGRTPLGHAAVEAWPAAELLLSAFYGDGPRVPRAKPNPNRVREEAARDAEHAEWRRHVDDAETLLRDIGKASNDERRTHDHYKRVVRLQEVAQLIYAADFNVRRL